MSDLYGLMAEFEGPEALVEAVVRTRQAGFTRFDSFSPFPIDDMPVAHDLHPGRISLFVIAGGLFGLVAGYVMQHYAAVHHYPLNIGGQPMDSPAAFVPVTLALVILCAALAGTAGLFIVNHLPAPYHPVFNVPAFRDATRNRFFLCIEAADPLFEPASTRAFLHSLSPMRVDDVYD